MKIIVDGIATEYDDTGQGPILLMLHGWQNDLHSFDLLISFLKNRYRIIRLDMPGFGGTEMPSNSWDNDDYILFINDFIEKLKVSDYCIVGHSFGCRVTMKGVAGRKLAPKRLVLIAAAGITKSASPRNQIYKIIAKVGKVMTSIPPLNMFRDKLRKKIYVRAGSDYMAAGLLKDTYLSLISEDLSSDARQINIPTLLIWGSLDNSTPLADGKLFSELIRGSSLVSLDGRSHFVHQEDPEKVSRLINDFCS